MPLGACCLLSKARERAQFVGNLELFAASIAPEDDIIAFNDENVVLEVATDGAQLTVLSKVVGRHERTQFRFLARFR